MMVLILLLLVSPWSLAAYRSDKPLLKVVLLLATGLQSGQGVCTLQRLPLIVLLPGPTAAHDIQIALY